jgi:hypothetical protein
MQDDIYIILSIFITLSYSLIYSLMYLPTFGHKMCKRSANACLPFLFQSKICHLITAILCINSARLLYLHLIRLFLIYPSSFSKTQALLLLLKVYPTIQDALIKINLFKDTTFRIIP